MLERKASQLKASEINNSSILVPFDCVTRNKKNETVRIGSVIISKLHNCGYRVGYKNRLGGKIEKIVTYSNLKEIKQHYCGAY